MISGGVFIDHLSFLLGLADDRADDILLPFVLFRRQHQKVHGNAPVGHQQINFICLLSCGTFHIHYYEKVYITVRAGSTNGIGPKKDDSLWTESGNNTAFQIIQNILDFALHKQPLVG